MQIHIFSYYDVLVPIKKNVAQLKWMFYSTSWAEESRCVWTVTNCRQICGERPDSIRGRIAGAWTKLLLTAARWPWDPRCSAQATAEMLWDKNQAGYKPVRRELVLVC